MQLDDLQRVWAAHTAALERSIAIDERLLREVMLRKVRFALAPYAVWRVLEVALGVAVLAVVLPVLVAHAGEPRYLVGVGVMVAFIAWITASCARLLVGGLRVDHGGPVTAIQRDIERLKLVEYRTFKWVVLSGFVLWLPAALVLFEVLTGVDALARVDLAWFGGNLLVGLAFVALGQALSRRYVERPDTDPRARRIVDALSGRGLRRASEHLAELASFVRDGGPS